MMMRNSLPLLFGGTLFVPSLIVLDAFLPMKYSPRIMSINEKQMETVLKLSNDLEPNSNHDSNYCIPLGEICLNDLPKVGGKTASLGEMIQELTPLGVEIPGGFGVTSLAYDAVLDQKDLRERLQELLKDIDCKRKNETQSIIH